MGSVFRAVTDFRNCLAENIDRAKQGGTRPWPLIAESPFDLTRMFFTIWPLFSISYIRITNVSYQSIGLSTLALSALDIVAAAVWGGLTWIIVGYYGALSRAEPAHIGWYNYKAGTRCFLVSLLMFVSLIGGGANPISVVFSFTACTVSGLGSYFYIGPVPRPKIAPGAVPTPGQIDALKMEHDILKTMMTSAIQFMAIVASAYFVGILAGWVKNATYGVDAISAGFSLFIIGIGLFFGITWPIVTRISQIHEELIKR